MNSGLFIVFEGIDGCGKTTAQKFLTKYLHYRFYNQVISMAEPSSDRIGGLARAILKEPDTKNNKFDPDNVLFNRLMTLLMTADRCDNLQKVVIPALKQNSFVLCSRYVLSTIAYQGRTQQDIDLIHHINQGFPRPDVTIYLDIDPEIAIERIKTRNKNNKLGANEHQDATNDRYETLTNLIGVRERYLAALQNYSSEWTNNWTRIDTGNNDPNRVESEIISYLSFLGIFNSLDMC